MDFNTLKIQDARLEGVEIDWHGATCTFLLNIVGIDSQIRLQLIGVTELKFPNYQPWRDCGSIKQCRSPEQGYVEIEMQSGDMFRIRARDSRIGARG